MSLVDTKTLAYHMARPLHIRRSYAETPLSSVSVKAVADSSCTKTSPDLAGATFYYLNHAVSLVSKQVSPLEPLGKYEWIIELYEKEVPLLASKMFQYLLLICSREARHASMNTSFRTNVVKEYGQSAMSFLNNIYGHNALTVYENLNNAPPNITLGAYTRLLVHIFFKAGFGSSFGGKAWGAIAHCLNRMVQGEYSPEMMLDTSFTLAHNNGPIFNKGIIFSSYTTQLRNLLDVQRAGMVPQLINDKINGCDYLPLLPTSPLQATHQEFINTLGGPYAEHMDWEVVKKMGALFPTSHFLHMQKSAPWNSGDKPDPEEMVYITPDLSVPKIVRKHSTTQKVWS